MKDYQQMRKDLFARIDSDIEESGFTIVATATEDGSAYSYTIGLSLKYSHPEIFIVGLDPKLSARLMHNAVNQIKAGKAAFLNNVTNNEIIEGYSVIFKMPQTDKPVLNPFNAASGYYESKNHPYAVVQMVIPDEQGKFYWEEGANPEFRMQAKLFE